MSESLAHAQTSSQTIVNLAAMSLSAARGLTESERNNRAHAVIQGVMEFQPADPAQTILATLILGHHLTIMDGFRDIACLTLNPTEAARARMVTVAETKLVPQLLRELRIERKEALTRAAEGGKPVPGPTGDAWYDTSPTKFMSVYTDALGTPENTDTVTPASAAKVRQALGQAIPSALIVPPKEENPVPGQVTGSRAQRRAMMKRNGAFKRHG